jgi:phosphinothricin acetyltransferase
MDIRDAADPDLPGILAIYNDAVQTTTAIWNERTVDLDDRRAWHAARLAQGYPVLVAADGAHVLGYATFGDWRAWDGYRHTVEHSVYVRADARGKGVASALLPVLIERARGAGKHVMIAGIEASNAPSIRLHEKLGFHPAGRLDEVGVKFGRWLDLLFMRLALDDRAPPPP